MALPNDSFRRAADGAGTDLATNLVSGKEYPVQMNADYAGHIEGSLPAYTFWIPPAVMTAGKIMWDIFNGAGSGKLIRLRGIWVIMDATTTVTGTLSGRLDYFRTSAVGTGGTAYTWNATANTAPSILGTDSSHAQPHANITLRAGPTAGATSQGFWFSSWHFAEETQALTMMSQFFNLVPQFPHDQPMLLREGFGMKCVAPAATAGNYGFLGAFTLE